MVAIKSRGLLRRRDLRLLQIHREETRRKKRVVDEQRKYVYIGTVFWKEAENRIWGTCEINILGKEKGSLCLQQEKRKKE